MEQTRILVIDDDRQVREMIKLTLERDGFDVVEAGDGVEAVEAYREGAFDLVICSMAYHWFPHKWEAAKAMARALKPGGVFAVWGENYDAGFVRRLQADGFAVTTERPGRGGLRHVVFLAQFPSRVTMPSAGRSRP